MKLLALLPLLAAAPALAQSFTDPAAIDRAVIAFSGAEALPVDRRLRLAGCAAPLALDWYGARQDTVLVQCAAPGWRLYVPLKLARTVAAEPVIARGDAVTIVLAGGDFTVSQSGEALEPGPVGAWIRVRGPSGQALRGKVLRPGTVGIELP